MSRLPDQISFDRIGIDSIKDIDDVKIWLKSFMNEFDRWYAQLFDRIENGGYETKTWRVKEATAADVTAGKADTIGNLMEQRKISGVWTTLRQNFGS